MTSYTTAALERAESERAAFLKEACGGDEPLRREVESLLTYRTRADTFIEQPALELAAEILAKQNTEAASTRHPEPGGIDSGRRVADPDGDPPLRAMVGTTVPITASWKSWAAAWV